MVYLGVTRIDFVCMYSCFRQGSLSLETAHTTPFKGCSTEKIAPLLIWL